MSNNGVRHRRVVTTDGLTLAVTAQGDPDRPTIVAVHGYPDDHTVWDGVVAELADRYHVVTYDVRGAGASDPPAGRSGYLLDQLAADLATVVDDVCPQRPVHLLAHDWGAIQAWHAVTGDRLRGRIASYTSVSGPCLDHVGAWLRRPSAASLKQALSSWYIAFFQLPVVPELAWRSGLFGGLLARREGIPTPALRDGVNGIELYRANMLAHLRGPVERRTDVPVQVLAPDGDAYVSTPMQTAIGRYVDDLAIRTLPGRHWLPRSRPDVIARCVRELVESVEHPEQPVAPALRTARTRDRGTWAGRTVVVTGAGSGIGRETVLAFARLGADVVAADRDLDTATETARLAGSGCAERIWAHQVDVADGAAMAEFAKRVAAEHGVPRLVVNNAGIGMAGPFADTTVANWQKIIDVNLWGVIHGCRLFAEQMREHGEGGQIVNTASAAAFTPAKTLSAYATTKAAVLMLSECLRAELAEHGIGVTAVCPGFVHTNITATTRFVGADAATEKRRQDTTTALYQRRNYTPDRVAAQIVTAAERNPALQPVTPEAHVSLALSRLAPGLVRAIARRDIGPRSTRRSTMTTTPDSDRVALNARDVAFDWSTLPVHWIPGRPFATHLVNVLHLLLPEGEHWFVRLFSEALPLIRDPHLAEDVRGFIGQEAMHAAAHESVHTHFASHGIDPGPYLRQVEFIFRDALGERGLTGDEAREWLVDRLAAVAAIEHLTAFLGNWILHADALDRAGAHPTMLDLLRWHGAEEVEHRSVAHDLYMHLDGSYVRRVRMLTVVGPMLIRLWAAGVVHLMSQDSTAPRATWSDLLRATAKGLCPGPVQTAWSVLTYLDPRYHPSQHGSTDDAVAYLAVSPAARAAAAEAGAAAADGLDVGNTG